MVLQFKFKYLSSDNTLARFLDHASSKYECEYIITREKDNVCLYIEGEDEIINKFSNDLASYIPMSVYYHDIKVDIQSHIPEVESISLIKDKMLSFCPSCLAKVEDEEDENYYNAFRSCSMCDAFDSNKFILDNEIKESSKELFSNIASMINENKKIKIKTLSGTFVFSKFEDIEKSTNLLVTNLKHISSLVVENKSEVVALASIEKPSLDLKINEIYKQKFSIKKEYINIRFANDLILYLLSLELQEYKIDFLSIEDESSHFDSFLDISLEKEQKELLDIPQLKCIGNRRVFLKSNSYPKNLDLVYSKFEQKDKSQFMTVLAENDLFEKSIMNFYISTKDDDGISMYSEKFNGLVDVVKPLRLPSSVEEVFTQISKDETGSRLVSNYKKKFPLDYEKAVNTDISALETKSFTTYFEILRIVLGFKEDILENANSSYLEKGPRIDYKFLDNEISHNKEFSYEKLIKSAMSFKIAGVDEVTISLGCIESLAHFIANEIDLINDAYDLDGVSLCGDMFTYELFSQLVEKSITKNFKIYYNKEFVIQK